MSYSEPVFLAFTIGAYYYWKREKFGYAALLAIFSIFTRQVGALILVIFLVEMLYGYFSHRERSRVTRELAVIAITCAGVAMLYLFYLYRFGNPFIVSSVEAANWKGTLSVANLFNNVRTYGFEAPSFVPFNYAVVPIFLVDTLLVVATRPHALRQLAQKYHDRHDCRRHRDPKHVHLDHRRVALLRT